MATAKATTFGVASDATIKALEATIAGIRAEGAPDDATVYVMFDGSAGVKLKVEWDREIPDPTEPPADTREQPQQAKPESA